MRRLAGCIVLSGLFSGASLAVGTGNGNDLALEFASAEPKQREAIRSEAVGKPYFFRYLKIASAEAVTRDGARAIRMATVEPSSEMTVEFEVNKSESLRKADGLGPGDAVAVTGRVRSLGEDGARIVLDPVIVRYRDRLAPTAGKELLYEVDPSARRGSETSSGKEVVIPAKPKGATP